MAAAQPSVIVKVLKHPLFYALLIIAAAAVESYSAPVPGGAFASEIAPAPPPPLLP